MSPPQDDENFTLGLPPGKLDRVLRESKAKPGPVAKDEPPAPPPPPERKFKEPPASSAPPRRPPAAPAGGWPGGEESPGGDMNTILPAAAVRRRSEPEAKNFLAPSQGQAPASTQPPPAVPKFPPASRQQSAPAGLPPSAPPPVGSFGWPSEDSSNSAPWGEVWTQSPECSTALPPSARTSPIPSPANPPRSTPAPPERPRQGAQHPPISSPPATEEKEDTSTPVQTPRQKQPIPPRGAPTRDLNWKTSQGSSDFDGRTIGANLVSEGRKQGRTIYTLQFYKSELQRWSDLGEVKPEGYVFGRHALIDRDDNPDSVADEHFKLEIEDGLIRVEPLASVNGVYVKLKPNKPVELAPGRRFRAGHHVLTFRPGGSVRKMQPLRSDEGEVFQSRTLVPKGFLDLIGIDGEPYLSFPLTKVEAAGTRLGRGGSTCDVALSEDDWVSSFHARLYFTGQTCMIEDMGSTNGTFLEIVEPALIHPGKLGVDPIRPQPPSLKGDDCDVILVGSHFLRIVHEQA